MLKVEEVLTARGRRWKRRLDVPVIAAALLVLPQFVVEQQLTDTAYPYLGAALTIIDWVFWGVIAGEFFFILRLTLNRQAMARRSLVDIAVIILTLPALPGVLVSLGVVSSGPSEEVLELLHLLRLALVVVRVRLGASRLFGAFGLGYGMLLLFLLVVTGGSLLSLEEDMSLGRGVWWAIVTVSTVGYGDVVPETALGRVLATVLIFLGISFIALFTGAVASRVANPQAAVEREELLAELQEQKARSQLIQDQLSKLTESRQSSEVSEDLKRMNDRLSELERLLRKGADPS